MLVLCLVHFQESIHIVQSWTNPVFVLMAAGLTVRLVMVPRPG
jgi:hypothetical protein